MKKNTSKLYVIKVEMTDDSQFETKSTWGSEGDVLKLEIDIKSHSAWTYGNKNLWINRISDLIKNFKILNQIKKNV